MALGGGTFVLQNKILPGAYINFVSRSTAVNLASRGVAALPISLGWGKEGEAFLVEAEQFLTDSMRIFGYPYDADEIKGIRDAFYYAKKIYFYRLNGGGTKASNDYATALYGGTRGNDIKIIIAENADDDSLFDVTTVLAGTVVDVQTVEAVTDLVANDYVTFKTTEPLEATAGIPLEGGTNSNVTGASHQSALDKLEPFAFNALGCLSGEETIKKLYLEYTKRMRDSVGKKFVGIGYALAGDYEGWINVKNTVTGGDAFSLVWWVTGVCAGMEINQSALNLKYNGDFKVVAEYTQSQLEDAIKGGEFTFHNVDGDVRVLEDINSLTSLSPEHGDIFQDNQTIRICDQIAIDIAYIFNNNFLGKVPNDDAGRISLKSMIVSHHKQLMKVRALENFEADDVKVSQGETKKSVVVEDAISIVNVMAKLYMTVTVA